MATRVITVNDILDGQVGLDLECLDRILCVPGNLLAAADLLIRRRKCPGMIPRWRCG